MTKVAVRRRCDELMIEAMKNGATRLNACKIMGISLRTVQRWKKIDDGVDGRSIARTSPPNKLSPSEREQVINVCCSKRFQNKSPNEIVPLMAQEGKYLASESTFYRILKEENLLSHRTNCRPKTYRKPPELRADGPNQLWSWDITYLLSSVKGSYYYLYLFMDVWSRAIIGWDIFENESSSHAAGLIDRLCQEHMIESIKLHSDNGGPMKGATMLATLQRLGVVPSFSRPHVSDDNPFSESLFKIVKYNVEYPPSHFTSVEHAKQWFTRFENWYGNEHLHSGIKFVTPNQRHTGADKVILQKRAATYRQAQASHPERWTGRIRNWTHDHIVSLNAPRKQKPQAAA